MCESQHSWHVSHDNTLRVSLWMVWWLSVIHRVWLNIETTVMRHKDGRMMIILVIAYRPLLGDQHWSVLKSRLDRLMRRLGQQRLGCLVSDEVWSVFGCLIGNMLVTAQCVCVYAWSRLVNVSHNTTLRWVCVHGDVNWLIVECSLSQWLIMRVPWLRQCCSNRGSTTLCARVPVLSDRGCWRDL